MIVNCEKECEIKILNKVRQHILGTQELYREKEL